MRNLSLRSALYSQDRTFQTVAPIQTYPTLLKSLPMIDVLVLDEADRMIADGHFKEMRDILAHIYT